MAEVHVTPWRTAEATKSDPTAPMHDCLWNMAHEQAILKRMKGNSEDWRSASEKVSQRDVGNELDTICDDNNFRRLDGSGHGRDPNLVHPSEKIKVRNDPKEAVPGGTTQQSDAKLGPESQGAYNKAVSDGANGVNPDKKAQLDAWLGGIKDVSTLPDKTKAALIDAYDREGVDRPKLGQLAESETFRKLAEPEQQRLLEQYGSKDKPTAKSEVDRLAASPPTQENVDRMQLASNQGFNSLTDPQQKQLLDRYSQDAQFHGAIDEIISQDNFEDKDAKSQGHALDILRRYSMRKEDGYGKVDEANRVAVLTKLYDEVLSQPSFKLNETRPNGQDTFQQDGNINSFALYSAPHIRA
jgi:hypothetical protein